MYDYVNGRMLSADPLVASANSSQAFNRYSYAFNNPLKYTDPDGRLPFLLAPLTFFAGSMMDSFFNNGLNGRTALAGWQAYNRASSGIASVTSVSLGQLRLGRLTGDLRFGLALGSSTGVGLSGIATYNTGNFTASVGGSLYGFAHTYGPAGLRFEATGGGSIGWNDGHGFANAYSSTFFSRGTSQRVGGVAVGGRNWSFATENDFLPGGDGGDRYRTASARVRHGQYSLGLRLFTGDPGDALPELGGGKAGHYPSGPADAYRAGVLSFSDGFGEIGINSEGVRHLFQNRLIHDGLLDILGEPSPWFNRIAEQFPWATHSQYGPARPFTLW